MTTTWPPGFKPKLVIPATSRKKSAAATKGREAKAAKGVREWGTNTVVPKQPKLES